MHCALYPHRYTNTDVLADVLANTQIDKHGDANQVAWGGFNQACILGCIVHSRHCCMMLHGISQYIAVPCSSAIWVLLILKEIEITLQR